MPMPILVGSEMLGVLRLRWRCWDIEREGLQGAPPAVEDAALRPEGAIEEDVEVPVPGGEGPYGFSLIGEYGRPEVGETISAGENLNVGCRGDTGSCSSKPLPSSPLRWSL